MFPVKPTDAFRDHGLVGAHRKFDIHTGLDFYCDEGTDVVAIADGVVADVFTFTGPDAGSPWWNTTKAVVLFCDDKVHVYGEVNPCVRVGALIRAGDKIGQVLRVLKTDKGVPTAMLHFELWNCLGYVRNYTWHRPQTRLTALLDPLSLFNVEAPDFWIVSSPSGYKVQNSVGEHQAFFTMAADSKAYVWGKTSVRLKANSPLEDKLAYTIATGKTLWFEDCKKEKYTPF